MTSTTTHPEKPADEARRTKLIFALIAVDFTLAGLVPVLGRAFASNVYLAAGSALIAVWTFFAFWLIQRNPRRPDPTRNSMRDAITVAFVVTYLVMVAWTAFFSARPSAQVTALQPITQTMLTNFTFLTGIVVGFYFGADAVKQVVQIRQPTTGITTGGDSKSSVERPSA